MKRVLSHLSGMSFTLAMLLVLQSLADQPSQQQAASKSAVQATQVVSANVTTNPNIDMEGHLCFAAEAAEHRKTRLIKEGEFIKKSKERGVLVLDCRSKDRFEGLHIKGAKNLSYPDITVDSLAKTIPDKETTILIYCNNNFKNDPKNFAAKRTVAALNISTFITLYEYGYRNIYELGEVIDMKEPEKSKLTFEGTSLQNR